MVLDRCELKRIKECYRTKPAWLCVAGVGKKNSSNRQTPDGTRILTPHADIFFTLRRNLLFSSQIELDNTYVQNTTTVQVLTTCLGRVITLAILVGLLNKTIDIHGTKNKGVTLDMIELFLAKKQAIEKSVKIILPRVRQGACS